MRHIYFFVALLWFAPTATFGRSVLTLSNWARESGIVMHPSVEWKDNGDDDWGLQLTSKVERGDVLIRVPRSLVLDSAVIKDEMVNKNDSSHDKDKISKCIEELGPFVVHEENFWIVLKLYQCQRLQDAKWAPWLAAMPRKFPQFSEAEQECLPFYAKYIAGYQKQKLEKFCQAAAVICGEFNEEEKEQFKWGFDAVGSRFWKTESAIEENYQPRSELVPLGDMFNHNDSPNVKIFHDHEQDAVCFLYLGGDEECYPQDLFITYGQPYNPHRFLMIFGFVPTEMQELWSHFIFSDTNPYSGDVAKMVFTCKDGMISQQVWDAVLHELDPSKDLEVLRLSPEIKWYAADVLNNHVTKQLDELNSLRQKLDAIEGENIGLIGQHNEFLTTVFRRVQANLKEELEKVKK
ncbi:hypothetical protein ACHAXR_010973 [Thalassiosira sp. AJA248-18]